MNKTLSFTNAWVFAAKGLANNLVYILLLTSIFTAIVGGCILAFPISYKAGLSSYHSLPHSIAYQLCITLIIGLFEGILVHKAFTTYHTSWPLAPLRYGLIIQFAILQVLRRIAIALGTLALIFPGIYIAIRYFFPGYTLFDTSGDSLSADIKNNLALTDNAEQALLTAALLILSITLVPFYLLLTYFLKVSSAQAQEYIPLIQVVFMPLTTFFYVHLYEQLQEQTSIW